MVDGRRSGRRTAPALGREALSGRLIKALDALAERDSPADAWRRAWLLTAMGRYGDALEQIDGALQGDLLIQSCARMTEGMLLRQVALHERAEVADAEALDLHQRSGTRSTAVRAGIRIGQVADAVGMGEVGPVLSRRLLGAAAATTASGSWRQRIRLSWVRGEVAMVRGRFAQAARSFAEGASIASDQGAERHTAKSLIFVAASRAARGDTHDAVRVATRGLHLAARCAAAPLVWPAELILAEVDPAESAVHLDRARRVAIGVLDTLPADLRAEATAQPPASWLLDGDLPSAAPDVGGEAGAVNVLDA